MGGSVYTDALDSVVVRVVFGHSGQEVEHIEDGSVHIVVFPFVCIVRVCGVLYLYLFVCSVSRRYLVG